MDELEELRGQAEALGVKVDGRWGADRIRAEISAAQSSPDEGEDEEGEGEDQAEDDAAEVLEELDDDAPPVHRAGGHIDRGDGRGWVIEE